MWFVLGVFAALTSILAKVGIEGVNFATAIRTVVVLAMAWGMVFVTNTQGGHDIAKKRRDPLGSGDGGVVAVLLPRGAADRGGVNADR